MLGVTSESLLSLVDLTDMAPLLSNPQLPPFYALFAPAGRQSVCPWLYLRPTPQAQSANNSMTRKALSAWQGYKSDSISFAEKLEGAEARRWKGGSPSAHSQASPQPRKASLLLRLFYAWTAKTTLVFDRNGGAL